LAQGIANTTRAALAALLLAGAGPASAQEPAAPLTLAQARLSLAGQWRGELQYRDYQSNEWVGIPVSVTVEPVGDGVTLLRRAVFDDGPKRGAVYITSLEMLGRDGVTEYATSFRAGSTPDIDTYTLTLADARDSVHWTIVATANGSDDDRPARLRETTTRNGDGLTTLKEVDFTDDAGEAWLQRNRTVLTRGG